MRPHDIVILLKIAAKKQSIMVDERSFLRTKLLVQVKLVKA